MLQKERIQNYADCVLKWIAANPLAAALIAVAALIVIAAIAGDDELASAIIGLAGVVIGALVTTVVSRETARQQLGGAGLSKRMEVHQAAFAVWRRKLLRNVYNQNREELRQAVSEAEEWWEENCLYMSNDARTAFKLAITTTASHAQLADAETRLQSYDRIATVPRLLIEGSGGQTTEQLLNDFRKEFEARAATQTSS